LYKRNTKTIWAPRTGDNSSILTLCNKRPLLATVQSGANMLATGLPNVVSLSNTRRLHSIRRGQTFVRNFILRNFGKILSRKFKFEFSRQNCNKISQYRISHKSLSLGIELFPVVDRFASLRVHQGNLTATSRGVQVEPRTDFSATFHS